MRNVTRVFMIAMSGFLCLTGCSEAQTDSHQAGHHIEEEAVPVVSQAVPVPKEFENGEGLFNNNCARCHGPRATGTQQGPPLVHKIYEPSHHADFAFQRAAAQGVRAHHWKFGNMPKIESVTPDDVTHIIGYIRWLQQQAGIF